MMDTVKINKGDALMIAHRGVSALETENTVSAFVAAGNRSYWGVESDVHVTADGKLVIIHDDDTKRVADMDMSIEGSDFEELRKIILKNLTVKDGNRVLGDKDRRDLIIPTLKEYISVCKKYEKTCVLELKNKFEADDIKKVIAEIKELDYLENVIFISFSFENMTALRSLLPEQRLQYLVGEFNDDILEKLDKYSLDIDIHYPALTKAAIDIIHKNGHKVNCWTCDSKVDAERLAEMGVDFITSNILE